MLTVNTSKVTFAYDYWHFKTGRFYDTQRKKQTFPLKENPNFIYELLSENALAGDFVDWRQKSNTITRHLVTERTLCTRRGTLCATKSPTPTEQDSSNKWDPL